MVNLSRRQSTEAPSRPQLIRDQTPGFVLPFQTRATNASRRFDAALTQRIQLALDHHLRPRFRRGPCPAATGVSKPRIRR